MTALKGGLGALLMSVLKSFACSLVKDETNKHQNYKYFDEAQILKILKPLLAEEQLTLTWAKNQSEMVIKFQRQKQSIKKKCLNLKG